MLLKSLRILLIQCSTLKKLNTQHLTGAQVGKDRGWVWGAAGGGAQEAAPAAATLVRAQTNDGMDLGNGFELQTSFASCRLHVHCR